MLIEIAKAKLREAWNEYRTCTDLNRKKELEKVMDEAQNSFYDNDQYWNFVKTLEGHSH